MVNNWLYISHIVVTVILVLLILIQNRSDGQSGFLGGTGETFKARRGVEKVILYLTIGVAIVFVALTIWIVKSN